MSAQVIKIDSEISIGITPSMSCALNRQDSAMSQYNEDTLVIKCMSWTPPVESDKTGSGLFLLNTRDTDNKSFILFHLGPIELDTV